MLLNVAFVLFREIILALGSDKLLLVFRDSSQFPHAAAVSSQLEIIQEQGQTIFVPSGWHHQVWNLVSIVPIVS